MAAINFSILAERLLKDSTQYRLVEYIYAAQGTEWKHLDYRAAGAALGCDKNTVGRYVTELADKKILQLRWPAELRLSSEICG